MLAEINPPAPVVLVDGNLAYAFAGGSLASFARHSQMLSGATVLHHSCTNQLQRRKQMCRKSLYLRDLRHMVFNSWLKSGEEGI